MQGKAPLVSIIVPVYGTETYLPGCIDSIRNQSYANIQVILVDDQSPDGCPEICDSYAQKDSRIVVIHQKNKGVSGARNTGMRHAAGDYIMFVDSDDELYPDAVKTLLQDAVACGADVVSADQFLMGKNDKRIGAVMDSGCSVYRDDQPLLLSLEGDASTVSACAKLFRADFIQDVYFEEGKNINEDGFFMFQCFLKKPVFVHHNTAVYQYNTRPGSGSRQAFSDKYLAMLYFCERKKELVRENCPQYMEQTYNMEVRTNLQMLDLLCRTTEKKYKPLQRQCVNLVRRLHKYHKPIHEHHKMLIRIVVSGLYPLYKRMVRLKYYRR